jgi:hypothetical protein
MGKTFIVDVCDTFSSDMINMPVTYQGNIIGKASSVPSGIAIVVDDIYVSVFEQMIHPSIKSFSLEVRTK